MRGAWMVMAAGLVATVAGVVGLAQASQAGGPAPVFEIVSVKQNIMGPKGFPQWVVADGLNVEAAVLPELMQAAYGYWGITNFAQDRIVGIPGWAKDLRYDIRAKVAADDVGRLAKVSHDDRLAMLRPILEDRFKLKTHLEKRETQVYALVVAKNGPKLKEASPDFDYPNKFGGKGTGAHRMGMVNGHFVAQAIPMSGLANYMTTLLHRSVIDETGLTGDYDMTLDYALDDGAGEPSTSASTGPSPFTALQEQLGLKLELRKVPIDFLIVDHIEQPSVN